MEIIVNGQSRQVAEGMTVAELLDELGWPAGPWPSKSISSWSPAASTPSVAWPTATAWKSSPLSEEDSRD